MPLQALLVEVYEREGAEAGLEEAAQVFLKQKIEYAWCSWHHHASSHLDRMPTSCHLLKTMTPPTPMPPVRTHPTNPCSPPFPPRYARRWPRSSTPSACAIGWASCRRASTGASSPTWPPRLRLRLRRRRRRRSGAAGDDESCYERRAGTTKYKRNRAKLSVQSSLSCALHLSFSCLPPSSTQLLALYSVPPPPPSSLRKELV